VADKFEINGVNRTVVSVTNRDSRENANW